MIATILYIYLAGWVGTTGWASYHCQVNEQRAISKSECHVISVIGGALWPVAVYEVLE